ncbi:MAG: hypothetical protein IJS32_05450 [Kiritimatiellae bacterium]|nr:hypothetical protein [Kiritimatiellia bacterium]
MRRLLLPLAAARALSACVTEVVRPERETTLSVARVGGESIVQWKGVRGVSYTLLHSDRGGAGWKPVAEAVNLRASQDGELLVVKEKVPAGVNRRYHLMQTGDAPAAKKR